MVEPTRSHQDERRAKRALGVSAQRRLDDLHDGVIQTLFGVGLTLQATAATADQDALAGSLEDAAESLAGVVRDLREYAAARDAATLDAVELEHTIEAMAGELDDAGGVRFRIEIERVAAGALGERGYQLVEILGALLAELARDHCAGGGAIRLYCGSRWIHLEITTEGPGWATPQRARLRWLASRLQWRLSFAREQCRGARATASVRTPVRARPAAAQAALADPKR